MNFELNLRTYLKQGNFKPSEPFFYPQAKESYDPVGVDKTAFKYSHQLPKGRATHRQLKAVDEDEEKKKSKKGNLLGNYLSTNPNMQKYSSTYRIKNVNELKMLLTKQTDQPALNWQTGLRPNLGNNSAWSVKVPVEPKPEKPDASRACFCPKKF